MTWLVCLVSTTSPLAALEWAHTDIQLLYGDGFIFRESRQRTTATLEHAHGWSYGDNFFFVDIANYFPKGGGSNVEAYGEWYSTLSLKKMFGFESPIPYVSDLAFSAGVNAGSRPTVTPYLAFLGGLRTTFDIPGFEYLQFYTQVIQYERQSKRGVQFTTAWSMPLTWGDFHFKFRGFMDVSSPDQSGDWHILSQPQLVLDVGSFAGTPDTVFFGLEWWIWYNKFGIPGATESAPQANFILFF